MKDDHRQPTTEKTPEELGKEMAARFDMAAKAFDGFARAWRNAMKASK